MEDLLSFLISHGGAACPPQPMHSELTPVQREEWSCSYATFLKYMPV